MTPSLELSNQRDDLRFVAALVLARTARAWGQPAKPAAPHNVTVAQIVDTSPEQQDVSRDFLIGARAARQDINATGRVKGQPVHHQSVQGDGSH